MLSKPLKAFVLTWLATAVLAANAASAASAGSYEDFFTALQNDDTRRLSDLFERGFDPNTRNEKGQPGLTIALLERSARAVELLLEQPNTDINALNPAGESALMMAALKGDIDTASKLPARGVKVNQAGWSALHYAACSPASKLVQLLIDRGAELDAASPNDTTPLMMAAQYGGEDNVRLLIAAGADAGRRNRQGLRAADFARLSGREFLVKRLELAAPR